MSRIDRLEQLVMSAMSNQTQPALPSYETSQYDVMPSGSPSVLTRYQSTDKTQKSESDREIDQLSTAFGVMKVDPAQIIYLGGAHWVSIMSEVILKAGKHLYTANRLNRYTSSETSLTPTMKR